jgi:hypothetical protein
LLNAKLLLDLAGAIFAGGVLVATGDAKGALAA